MSNHKNITALVVDDEFSTVEYLNNSLKNDYNIKVAYDGESALEIMGKGNINVVLLDLKMPKIDGIKVAETINSSVNLKDIPIIVMTGHHDRSLVAKVQEVGVDFYLTKPLNIDEVKSAIDSLT